MKRMTLRDKQPLCDYANDAERRQAVLDPDPPDVLPAGQNFMLVSLVACDVPGSPHALRMHGVFESREAADTHFKEKLIPYWQRRELPIPPRVYHVNMGHWLPWPPPLSETETDKREEALDFVFSNFYRDQIKALQELISKAEDAAPDTVTDDTPLLKPHELELLKKSL